ncbi:MAG: hypothetical protein JWN04_2005 [Myxococcaceae bacterium]|nr:hypothetical protein [Myxococcaceae bacterium]
MSRIEKLKVLLARVEQRRAEPRLVAVSNASALASANSNLAPAARGREPQLELATPVSRAPEGAARAPARPTIEQAIAPLAPSSIPPPPTDLNGLDSERPAARSSSLPPLPRTPIPPPPSSTVPPAVAASEAHGRAPTEVLPSAPLRIAPAPAAPFDSAVRATSAPRVEAPKTFGELLEQSLALRPKSG